MLMFHLLTHEYDNIRPETYIPRTATVITIRYITVYNLSKIKRTETVYRG